GIEFIRICETDDDIQVESVGTEVSSATDVCIDGGVDLTIDEMKKEDKFGNPIFLQGDDVLFQDPQTGKYFVLAGDNLTCETEAQLAGPPECPSVFYTTNYIDAANNVLNKVGIDVFDAGVTTYYYNYNLYLEDGIMYANEQKLLHEHFHGDNPASTTQVFLVNDLGIGRSEERRVGKECRSWGRRCGWRE